MHFSRPSFTYRYFTVGFLFAALHLIFGQLGVKFASLEDIVSLLWPPTGLSLAAMLIFGPGLWPFVTLGNLIYSAFLGSNFYFTVCVAIGNTIQALLAWALLNENGFRKRMERVQDVLLLVLFAALAATMVSALCGAIGMMFLVGTSWNLFLNIFWIWWIGNTMGVLIVTPFLLSLRGDYFSGWSGSRLVEWSCLNVSLILSVMLVFIGVRVDFSYSYPLAYLPFPFIIWAAFRFGIPGATLANLLVASIAAVGTIYQKGPFFYTSVHHQLILVWSFMGIIAVSALILAAALKERENAQMRLASALESDSTGLWDWDIQSGRIYLDRNWARLFGYPDQDYEETVEFWEGLIHPDDVDGVRESLARHVRRHKMSYEDEFRACKRNGRWMWVRLRGQVIEWNRRGIARRMAGTIRDVSMRKQIESELHLARNTATNPSPDSIVD